MGAKTFLNFDLLLERAGENSRARVLHSPGGQVAREFVRPFSPQDLDAVFFQLSRNNADAARAFGKQLFDAVFADDIKIAYGTSAGIAAGQGAGLRIRLRLNDAPELAGAPWELLHDGQDFLALSAQRALVRYLELAQPLKPFAAQPPLRALVVISSPRDYETLDVAREWARLQDALADVVGSGLFEIELLERATFADLQEQLRKNQYHILHFSGHGEFDERAANDAVKGNLVFVNEAGRGHAVDALTLGRVLNAHDALRLVVLNACEGARADTRNAFAGAAQTLMTQSVPAVVAMQFPITDDAAQKFSRALYSAFADGFADGFHLDAALSEARRAMQPSGLEWATPVLFSRQEDALFELPALSDAQKRELQRAALTRLAIQALDAENFARASEFANRLMELDANDLNARRLRETIQRKRELAEYYAQGKNFVAQEHWQDAADAFNQVFKRQVNYRDTTALLSHAQAMAARTTAAPATPRAADEYERFYKDMARELLRGKIVPFFGHGANLYGRALQADWKKTDGAPSAVELAKYLADNFDYDESDASDLFRVSQYVAVTQSNPRLYEELHEIFAAPYAPTPLHRFWAELPALLRTRGPLDFYPIIVTANYDLLLEQAFQAQDEPFDTLIYLADGAQRGKFLHRTYKGAEIPVDDPSEYPNMRLNERTTIIRVQGAVGQTDSAYESFVVTEDHFLDLFQTDVVSLMPRTVGARLRESYVLFMGCNLRNWYVRGLLDRLARTKYRPWLVQPQIRKVDRDYWRSKDVQVLDVAFDAFLLNLSMRVNMSGGAQ